jgi:predicted ABC-type ATPase
MTEDHPPLLIMIAGPNGAGKTTFYEAHLAHVGLPFINADIIARRLQLAPYDAAEEATRIRETYLEKGISFICETVFSDPVGAKLEFLTRAIDRGFDVRLIFIQIRDIDLSIARVKDRTAAGGHDVPEDKLENRFPRTQLNLKKACKMLPYVQIYDNTSSNAPYRLMAEYKNGRRIKG